MFNSPGMQSLMQQIMQNPQTMENMMQAPYMQAMLQNMASNPELTNQVRYVNEPSDHGKYDAGAIHAGHVTEYGSES